MLRIHTSNIADFSTVQRDARVTEPQECSPLNLSHKTQGFNEFTFVCPSPRSDNLMPAPE